MSRITKKTLLILKLHSEGLTLPEICNSVNNIYSNTTYASVALRINRNGLKSNPAKMPRRTSLNEDYFKKIDSHRKSYFFGLLCADGNVNSNINRVSLSLKVDDELLINEFIKEIGYSGKITIIKRDIGSIQKGVQIYSKKMVSDLVLNGCYDRKSLSLELPNIKHEFFGSFLRGYFDGDGWAFEQKENGKTYKRLGFIGSIPFCKSLFDILNKRYGINSCFHIPKEKHYASLHISSQDSVYKLREIMYAFDSISLERKKSILYKSYIGEVYLSKKRIIVNW